MSFAQKYAANTLGALEYKGAWDATANLPALASSTGDKGDYYIVTVAGTTNLNGITDWQPGDWVIFSGTTWQKIDNSESVVSVAGKTGEVVLNKNDVGLENVDNTSDINKPVSHAQRSAIDLTAYYFAIVL